MSAASAIVFLDALEHSFLEDGEKLELREAAEAGVDERLWNDFNDRLIAAVVRRQQKHKRFVRGLDDEINRFTADYEKEKALIDRHLWDALRELPEGDEARDRLWKEYGVKIRELQAKLIEDVRRTSTTVLHDAILAVFPAQGGQ